MNPLILNFKEKPKESMQSFSSIEYSEKLNLSIDSQTGQPAIAFLNLSTSTFTKVYNETTDSDNDLMNVMMGTMTKTSYQLEGTDDDASYKSHKYLMGTSTLTLVSQEGVDSDLDK